MTRTLKLGDRVVIPWGIGEVSDTVAEVYGRVCDRQVVVALTTELSGFVVDQPTTVSFPIGWVRPEFRLTGPSVRYPGTRDEGSLVP